MGCCGKIIKGAAGLAKAAAGIDKADSRTIAARRAACLQCEHLHQDGRLRMSTGAICWECRCFLIAKTRIAGETCPIGKW